MMTRAEQEKERQEWAARIADYRASGQSVSKWCAANGIRPGRLWYRLRRERDQEKANEADRVGPVWLRATVTGQDSGESDDAKLLIHMGEAVVEVKAGFDPELLSRVVRVLSTVC